MTVYGRAIGLLAAQPTLAGLAADPFGFDIRRAEHGAAVRLASGGALEPIAGDDTGGTYFVCGTGAVLYARAEGRAGVIGDSVDEALEMLVGLPCWQDLLHLSPAAGEQRLPADVAAAEEERRRFVPDLEARRAELRTALGFPDRSPHQLVGRLYAALLRTEPDHLLVSAADGRAHPLLDPHPRPPLRETVLAPGLADLATLRDDISVLPEVAADGARRAAVLRAAQYDRRTGDLPVLRQLLVHEAAEPTTSDELRLAVVLVAQHGAAEDLPLLSRIRASKSAARWGPSGMPEDAERFAGWARATDGALFGEDPSREPALTWIRLARRQGRTEHARVALLRALDSTGPQPDLLRVLSAELEALGDYVQAARAQSGYASLQGTPRGRASACRKLTELLRLAGDLPAAWQTLRKVPAILEEEDSEQQWRRLGFGRLVAAEHFELALAAARAKLTSVARESLAVATELQSGMGKSAHRSLGMLSQEAKWAVAGLK